MAWRGRGLPREDQSRVPGSAWRTTSDAVSSFSLVGAMSQANRVATLGSGMERNGRWPASPVPSPVTTTPWFTIQPEAAWCCKEVITGTESFEDTWVWDDREWSHVSSKGPGARDAHQLVYDRTSSRVVLFGGMYLDGGRAVVLADTWTWDGEWKMLHEGGGNGRSHYSMSFEPGCECLLRFGGGDPRRVPRGRTWRFMEGKWNELNVDGPDTRVDHDMVLDSSRNRVVLFGGYIPTPGGEIFGDTWEWDGEAWARR